MVKEEGETIHIPVTKRCLVRTFDNPFDGIPLWLKMKKLFNIW